MKELEYPFDAEYILSKKKKLRREILAGGGYCFIARRGNKPPLLSGVPIMPPLRRPVYNFCQNLRFFAIEGIIAICQVENKMDFVKSVASFDRAKVQKTCDSGVFLKI